MFGVSLGDIAQPFMGTLTMGASMQADAAAKAASLQKQAADAGIAEQRRQFDALQAGQAPYTAAGGSALQEYLNMLGLGSAGMDGQQSAMDAISASPLFQSLMQQGENAILQNASATGGLRGGNVQAALGQFRPAMLAEQINQQFSRLGGLATMGQNAAAGVGAQGMGMANQISSLFEQKGAAGAGGVLGQAAPWVNLANLPLQVGAAYLGGGGKF